MLKDSSVSLWNLGLCSIPGPILVALKTKAIDFSFHPQHVQSSANPEAQLWGQNTYSDFSYLRHNLRDGQKQKEAGQVGRLCSLVDSHEVTMTSLFASDCGGPSTYDAPLSAPGV